MGIEESNMSLAVSLHDGKIEWGSSGLSSFFADKRRIFSFSTYRLMYDMIRFNDASTQLLLLQDSDPRKHITLGEFLIRNGYSDAFQQQYLLPITASLWSSSEFDCLKFSALNVISFMHTHKMLQLFKRPQWLTCSKQSAEYVNKIVEQLGNRLELGNAVVSVTESPEGRGWQVRDSRGEVREFDQVIFACHADVTLSLLKGDSLNEERVALGAIKFRENQVYVHTDQSLMPIRKATWSSWNYVGNTFEDGTKKKQHMSITYWMNSLQNLDCRTNIFVSLNPTFLPHPSKTYLVKMMRHPQFTPEAKIAQNELRALNGRKGAWFAGAWMGHGFHEDGFQSGIEVATGITHTPVPWAQVGRKQLFLPKATAYNVRSSFISILDPLRPLRNFFQHYVVEGISFWCIQGFMRRGMKKGYLSIKLPDGRKLSFGDKSEQLTDAHSTIRIFDWKFFTRVAMEFDVGFSKSYMAGEFIVESNEGDKVGDSLVRFFNLLCLNRGYEGKISNTLYSRQVLTSTIGSTLNWLYLRLSLDNSISGSHSNVHAHYDISNDLFAIFLDKDYMMYSSAIYDVSLDDRGTLTLQGSLEDAEIRKIDNLLDRSNLNQSHHLLDVGFGWGGICIRAAMRYGCRVTGITLSEAQKEEAEKRVNEKRLGHLITFHLVDYRVFAKANPKKFDRIVSCEMVEAVGHNYLGDYFAAIDRLLVQDGIFVMEAITTPEVRYREYLKSTDFISTVIFPGSCCPSLTAMINAMEKHSSFSLEGFDNIALHYAQTLREWRWR